MDSASSVSPPSTRDVPPEAVAAAEEDTTLTVVAGLAKEAALLFQAGKFVECLRVLNQLLQKKRDDPRVCHNIAIAESFQDGFSDPKRLIRALQQIQKQGEELAHTSGEHLDLTSNDGSAPTAGLKGSNNAGHQLSSSSVVNNDEFDSSVTMFNMAVIWFLLHEYSKSFTYLDALFQNIEPIDEGTALRICLLFLDVTLLSQHASRSADVISYMEKIFCINSLPNQVENGTSALQHPSLVSRSASLPGHLTVPDSSHSDSVVSPNTLENSWSGTLSDEAPEDDSLPPSPLAASGHSFQRFSGLSSSNDIPRTQTYDSLSSMDLRHNLLLYKVRFLLLTRNLKAAKREVKMVMNSPCGKDNPMSFYLKSQLEYIRKNPRKAIKLLLASNSHTETRITSMYYNNLGCIYYQMGKHQTSGVFFSKALKSSSGARKEKPPKLLTLSQDKSLLISYNCGMHSLASGRPINAARCFQKASIVFYNRPLLWLRVAECCLMALEKGLIKPDTISSGFNRSEVEVNVIGKGKWRHIVLKYGNDDLCSGDGKQHDLSLSLAWQCLMNAIYLLDSSEAKRHRPDGTESTDTVLPQKESNVSSGSSQVLSNGEVKEPKSSSSSIHNSVAEYEQIRMRENQMIKQATLADLAYVELALGNPVNALSTAKSLLKIPDCSKMYTFLATMYAAEALCLLNRPQEAADQLMTLISSGGNVDFPYTREDCEKWTTEKVDHEDSKSVPNESNVSIFPSPEQARGIFCANYAANAAFLGDFDQAQHFITKALSDTPNSPQAILTAIYLDLKRGRTEEALTKMKQHGAFRFLSGSFSLNGSS